MNTVALLITAFVISGVAVFGWIRERNARIELETKLQRANERKEAYKKTVKTLRQRKAYYKNLYKRGGGGYTEKIVA